MTVSYSNAKADWLLFIDHAYDTLITNMPAINTTAAAAYSGYDSDNVASALALQTQTRTLGVQLWQQAAQAVQDQTVQVARSVGYTGTDFEGAARYWIRYMTDSGEFSGGSVSEKFTARGLSRGTLNSPTGVTLYRQTYDRWGQASQVGKAEVIRATLNTVSSSSTYGVTLQGEEVGQDVYDQQGSGQVTEIAVEDPDTTNLLTNANLSHSIGDGGAIVADTINGWTCNTSKWIGDTGKLFRDATSSIEANATGATIEQALPANLAPGTPYLPYAIVNPTSASGMSVRFDWGGINQASISVGSDDSWNIVTPDVDGDIYPEQFDSNGGVVKLTVTLSGGSLVVARIGLLPLTVNNFGTRWGAIVGSANPVLNATSTITDTLSISGKCAHIMSLLGVSLPTTGSNAISDP